MGKIQHILAKTRQATEVGGGREGGRVGGREVEGRG